MNPIVFVGSQRLRLEEVPVLGRSCYGCVFHSAYSCSHPNFLNDLAAPRHTNCDDRFRADHRNIVYKLAPAPAEDTPI